MNNHRSMTSVHDQATVHTIEPVNNA